MSTAPKRELQTIKHGTRKFLVVNRSATCMLLKRAGKIQWFTLVDGKEGKPVRHEGFWEALKAHADNLDKAGVKMEANTQAEINELLAIEDHEAQQMAQNLENHANA